MLGNECRWLLPLSQDGQAATPASPRMQTGLHDSCAADLLLVLTAYCLHGSLEQASVGRVH